MTEQDIDQKFDEILMFIYAGKIRNGKNIFANVINKAVNRKLDQVLEIVEQHDAGSLHEKIRELKDN